MCGICGIFSFESQSNNHLFLPAVQRMNHLMRRRGPDSDGFWADPAGHAYFGFRRLAILDLSPNGNQPMYSQDERSTLVYNGELYNFQALRHELEQKGIRFRSHSDSEVLLEALNMWGIDVIQRLNGMFAFAWYDRRERTLTLARDHAGIKPLYYSVDPQRRGVAFGSQYNLLLHTPWGVPGDVRQDALRLYLRLHHLPPPYGILENTFQLEPGHYLRVHQDGRIENRAWWRLPRTPDVSLSIDDAAQQLTADLDVAVRQQRLSDVPLGVFLSGGVDSPLVTAVARQQTDTSLKAFTIGSPGWWQDESADAQRYAQKLEVDHRIHNISPQMALDTIEDVITAQHEPFADFSMVPTLLISKFARQEVTVALSGDGGDELFFGYERPLSLLRNGADFRFPRLARLALYGAGKYGIGPKRSDVIVHPSPGDYYFNVNARVSDEVLRKLTPDLAPLPTDFSLYDFGRYRDERDLANFSRYVEFYGQLQRGLKKVDMASMHHSLEVRVPLLDRRIIDTSLKIDPFDVMRGGGTRKAILRDELAKHVGAELIPTSKRGFAVPLGDWFRTSLRPAVESLYEEDLQPLGLFDRAAVRQYCQAHLSGERDLKWGLWTLLSLKWWFKHHFNIQKPENLIA